MRAEQRRRLEIRSIQLLGQHQYDQAEKLLRRDYSQDERGGAQIDNINRYAIALIGNKKYSQAIDHIKNIILPKRGVKPSCHEILLGIAHWFSGQYKKAVEYWQLALKAGYASDKGYTDVYSMLFFASIQRPALVNYDELVASLSKYHSHLDERAFPDKVYKYYLGVIDDAALQGYATLCNRGYNTKDELYDGGELKDRGKAYYHLALRCLRNKDRQGYFDKLRLCVNMEYDQYQVEFLVAYLEVQRIMSTKYFVPGYRDISPETLAHIAKFSPQLLADALKANKAGRKRFG